MCMKRGYNPRKKQFVIYDHWETHMHTKIEMETADDTWIDKERGDCHECMSCKNFDEAYPENDGYCWRYEE